jgi:hypothetical protein
MVADSRVAAAHRADVLGLLVSLRRRGVGRQDVQAACSGAHRPLACAAIQLENINAPISSLAGRHSTMQVPFLPLDSYLDKPGMLNPLRPRPVVAAMQRSMDYGNGLPAWGPVLGQRTAEAIDTKWFHFPV